MGWSPELLRRLIDHNVEFFIIGGVAAIFHGGSRMTQDLDLCAPLTHENVVRIIEALEGINPKWRFRPDLPVITPDNHNLRGLNNLYLRTDLGQLDVLGEIPGIGLYEEVKTRTTRVTYRGLTYHVVDIDTLIAAKEFANRERDRFDVKQLKNLREARQQARANETRADENKEGGS